MHESFGTRLRRQREEQAIALVTIADETKIKRSLLEALERDDVSQWPSGIFRRAFIRAYAHAIRLDPDEIVREFLDAHPDPIEDVASLTAIAAAVDGPRGKDGATKFRYFVGSAIESLSKRRAGTVDTSNDGTLVLRDAPASDDPAPTGHVAPADHAMPADEAAPSRQPVAADVDLLAVADLCTQLAVVESAHDVQPLLQEASRILDAVGLIVWIWDAEASELRPALAHGYSDKVLAQLPAVRRDADNATAAAFRSGQVCAIKGRPGASGALVVPLLTASGCAGVFAIELPHGAEQTTAVRAVVTILGAQLAQLLNGSDAAEVDRETRQCR